MKSAVASLRELTLPFGATTGGRIELDGVEGAIRIYDSDGNLMFSITPEFGLQVWDPNGFLRVELTAPLAGAYAALEFISDSGYMTDRSFISQDAFAGIQERMVLCPGEDLNQGTLELLIGANHRDNTSPSWIAAIGPRNSSVSFLRPWVDFSGIGTPNEAQYPYTKVYELYQGPPGSSGPGTNLDGIYGRGILDYAETATPVGGITTTDVDVGLEISWVAKSTHVYKVTAHNNRGLSSTTANDLMRAKIADAAGTDQEQANVTAVVANRALPYTVVEFISGTSGTLTRKVQAVRGAGAGTIVHDAAAGSLARLWVEDLGG